MRTFFTEAETDDGVKITVEYHYEDNSAVIDDAERNEDARGIELSDQERERIETWINEHRYFDDHAE